MGDRIEERDTASTAGGAQLFAPIDFAVELERRSETSYVVALAGEVDLYTAPEFKRKLLAAIDAGGRTIVIDLTRATFIDSTFLGALLAGQRRLRSGGGRLSIVCTDRNLLKVFEITGLDRVFQIIEAA